MVVWVNDVNAIYEIGNLGDFAPKKCTMKRK